MKHTSPPYSIASCWMHLSYIIFLFCVPAYGAERIDGFRDLKFGMSQEEVKKFESCSTAHECLYDLSGKIRYLHLSYDKKTSASDSQPSEPPQLVKITIDMGQYSDMWHQQLQKMMADSYRLTHDFTDEIMKAFIDKELQELKAGYEDGQIVLVVTRRQFGNMTLKVVYQNSRLAEEFVRQVQTPLSATP